MSKEYSIQYVTEDNVDDTLRAMLNFGWEIITRDEYEHDSTAATRRDFVLYEAKTRTLPVYFARDKQRPHYAEFAQIQDEIFDLARYEEPKKPEKYDLIVIALGVLFPIIGIVLIIGAVTSNSKYKKKKEEYDRVSNRVKELLQKAMKLLEKTANELGDTLEEYCDKQMQKLKEAWS